MKVKKLKESASRLSKYAGDSACIGLPMYSAIKDSEEMKKRLEDRFKEQDKARDEFIKENELEEKPKPIKDAKLKKLHLSESLFEDVEDDEEEYITDMFDFVYNLFARDRKTNKKPYNPLGRNYHRFNYTSQTEDGDATASIATDTQGNIILFSADEKGLEDAKTILDMFEIDYDVKSNKDDYMKYKMVVYVPQYADGEPMLTIDFFGDFDELKKVMPVSTRLKKLLTALKERSDAKRNPSKKLAQEPSKEEATDEKEKDEACGRKKGKKKLNEGPGAGYTIKSKGYNFRGSDFNDTEITQDKESDTTTVIFKGDFEGVMDSFEAASYYYSTGEVEDLSIKCNEIKATFYNQDAESLRILNDGDGEVTPDNINLVELFTDVIDYLTQSSDKFVYGGGWAHSTYDGTVTRLDDILDSGYYDLYADIKLANEDDIKRVDEMVQGFMTRYYVVYESGEQDDFGDDIKAAIDFAEQTPNAVRVEEWETLDDFDYSEAFKVNFIDVVWERGEEENESLKKNNRGKEVEESLTITKEIDLPFFEPWSGAKDTFEELTYEELEKLEDIIADAYPEGMTETELNDLFWFEEDTLAEWLGYEDWEDLVAHHNGEEEIEETYATESKPFNIDYSKIKNVKNGEFEYEGAKWVMDDSHPRNQGTTAKGLWNDMTDGVHKKRIYKKDVLAADRDSAVKLFN